VNIKSANGKSR